MWKNYLSRAFYIENIKLTTFRVRGPKGGQRQTLSYEAEILHNGLFYLN